MLQTEGFDSNLFGQGTVVSGVHDKPKEQLEDTDRIPEVGRHHRTPSDSRDDYGGVLHAGACLTAAGPSRVEQDLCRTCSMSCKPREPRCTHLAFS